MSMLTLAAAEMVIDDGRPLDRTTCVRIAWYVLVLEELLERSKRVGEERLARSKTLQSAEAAESGLAAPPPKQ